MQFFNKIYYLNDEFFSNMGIKILIHGLHPRRDSPKESFGPSEELPRILIGRCSDIHINLL
jgi:hypothetical protein